MCIRDRHQYATSVFNAATMASIMQSNYSELGILDEAFTFEIPVYENMPSQPSSYPPGTGNNNCYLDDIVVSANGKSLGLTTEFNRFTSSYTVKDTVGKSTTKLTITTKKNVDDSKVTISGNQLVNGQNKITIKCQSSSGLVSKYYYLYVTKDNSIDEMCIRDRSNSISLYWKQKELKWNLQKILLTKLLQWRIL